MGGGRNSEDVSSSHWATQLIRPRRPDSVGLFCGGDGADSSSSLDCTPDCSRDQSLTHLLSAPELQSPAFDYHVSPVMCNGPAAPMPVQVQVEVVSPQPAQFRAASESLPKPTSAKCLCLAGHELQSYVTTRDGYTCDCCNTGLHKGSTTLFCRACNYDLCQRCAWIPQAQRVFAAPARVESAPAAPVAPAAPLFAQPRMSRIPFPEVVGCTPLAGPMTHYQFGSRVREHVRQPQRCNVVVPPMATCAFSPRFTSSAMPLYTSTASSAAPTPAHQPNVLRSRSAETPAAEKPTRTVQLHWSPDNADYLNGRKVLGYRVWARPEAIRGAEQEWRVLLDNTNNPEPCAFCEVPRQARLWEFSAESVVEEKVLEASTGSADMCVQTGVSVEVPVSDFTSCAAAAIESPKGTTRRNHRRTRSNGDNFLGYLNEDPEPLLEAHALLADMLGSATAVEIWKPERRTHRRVRSNGSSQSTLFGRQPSCGLPSMSSSPAASPASYCRSMSVASGSSSRPNPLLSREASVKRSPRANLGTRALKSPGRSSRELVKSFSFEKALSELESSARPVWTLEPLNGTMPNFPASDLEGTAPSDQLEPMPWASTLTTAQSQSEGVPDDMFCKLIAEALADSGDLERSGLGWGLTLDGAA